MARFFDLTVLCLIKLYFRLGSWQQQMFRCSLDILSSQASHLFSLIHRKMFANCPKSPHNVFTVFPKNMSIRARERLDSVKMSGDGLCIANWQILIKQKIAKQHKKTDSLSRVSMMTNIWISDSRSDKRYQTIMHDLLFWYKVTMCKL